jgi:hypothetical protein
MRGSGAGARMTAQAAVGCGYDLRLARAKPAGRLLVDADAARARDLALPGGGVVVRDVPAGPRREGRAHAVPLRRPLLRPGAADTSHTPTRPVLELSELRVIDRPLLISDVGAGEPVAVAGGEDPVGLIDSGTSIHTASQANFLIFFEFVSNPT